MSKKHLGMPSVKQHFHLLYLSVNSLGSMKPDIARFSNNMLFVFPLFS